MGDLAGDTVLVAPTRTLTERSVPSFNPVSEHSLCQGPLGAHCNSKPGLATIRIDPSS